LTFLLDTNVVSEPRRRRPNTDVLRWLQEQSATELFMSVLTVGEVIAGARLLERRDPPAGRSLLHWFATVRSNYAERILPVTETIVETWGDLQARRPLPVTDGLLAATVLVHELVLVTRNERDFQGLGLDIVNPWG
jgi:predicted nucleic acid-binding protein